MNIDKMEISDFELIKDNLKSDFDDFWSKDLLKKELLNPDKIYIIAKESDEIVGFAGIYVILDEAEIMNIVVKKNKRGQGIGKALMEKIINISRGKNLRTIKLEVNEKNTIAISLYKSLGFIQTGIRKKYYNSIDNAILMDFKI